MLAFFNWLAAMGNQLPRDLPHCLQRSDRVNVAIVERKPPQAFAVAQGSWMRYSFFSFPTIKTQCATARSIRTFAITG